MSAMECAERDAVLERYEEAAHYFGGSPQPIPYLRPCLTAGHARRGRTIISYFDLWRHTFMTSLSATPLSTDLGLIDSPRISKLRFLHAPDVTCQSGGTARTSARETTGIEECSRTPAGRVSLFRWYHLHGSTRIHANGNSQLFMSPRKRSPCFL